jgi:Zn-finger nucleic acid-binding protein
MHCPKDQTELQPLTVGGVRVDACPKCKGLWFDREELRKAKDVKLPDASWFDIHLWKDTDAFKGVNTDRLCPRDGRHLVELEYGDTGVKIDACRHCEGIWLDRGEFEKILAEIRSTSDAALLNDYWGTLKAEAKDIFTGPEDFASEARDLATLIDLFKYKFQVQAPRLAEFLSRLPRA